MVTPIGTADGDWNGEWQTDHAGCDGPGASGSSSSCGTPSVLLSEIFFWCPFVCPPNCFLAPSNCGREFIFVAGPELFFGDTADVLWSVVCMPNPIYHAGKNLAFTRPGMGGSQ